MLEEEGVSEGDARQLVKKVFQEAVDFGARMAELYYRVRRDAGHRRGSRPGGTPAWLGDSDPP